MIASQQKISTSMVSSDWMGGYKLVLLFEKQKKGHCIFLIHYKLKLEKKLTESSVSIWIKLFVQKCLGLNEDQH